MAKPVVLPDLSKLTDAELRKLISAPTTSDADFYAAQYECLRRHLEKYGMQLVLGKK